jgi:hypothetical protein
MSINRQIKGEKRQDHSSCPILQRWPDKGTRFPGVTILIRARDSTTGRLPFRFSFAIDFVNGEAIMILIVDHRSRLPEGIPD